MKIFSLFFVVLLLMIQGTSGFMRAPNNDLQCKQAGGTCSTDHCPLPNTRSFGRCQEGVPCCRTVDLLCFSPGAAWKRRRTTAKSR
ncbi:gallinacin-8-like [Opisthocomus hoazin]|uniref:gallinacin-8-like n=1 Tax=Opisthocomus hoazin TaxID=30419 RepID=UPI003F52D5D0